MVSLEEMVAIEGESKFCIYFEDSVNRFQMNQLWDVRRKNKSKVLKVWNWDKSQRCHLLMYNKFQEEHMWSAIKKMDYFQKLQPYFIYQLPVATIANYHTIVDLKQQKFMLLQLIQKSKIKALSEEFPSGGSEGEYSLGLSQFLVTLANLGISWLQIFYFISISTSVTTELSSCVFLSNIPP